LTGSEVPKEKTNAVILAALARNLENDGRLSKSATGNGVKYREAMFG